MSHRKLSTHPLRSLLHRSLAHTAAGALGAAAPLAALANPTGGQVVAGSATIGTPSANGLVINQSSQRAVINWQQFSVGANQYVQFVQPNSSAVVLNRVIGSNPSSIFGNIIANGQVFLVNPNGVYFAPGASVDVQGLVASTLDLRDSDFMQGKYAFHKAAGAPDATVVNQGSISSGPGGYVVLAGDYVENDGSINAQAGRVVLAAGGAATLTLDQNQLISYVVNGATLARLAGVDNAGSITANGAGGVIMTADVANALTATAVNNSGLITAHSVRSEGGEIVLLAQGGGIENSGTLDASAGSANGVRGGTVIIHGDGHTQLDPTSVIDASGNDAKGGLIELSGHTLSLHGTATAGQGGSLLIDPAKINITTGTGVSQVSAGTGTVGTGYIASHLNAGSNVTIVASNSIGNAAGTATIVATNAGAAGATLKIAIGTVSIGPSCGIGGICAGVGTPSVSPGTGNINLTGLTFNIKSTLDVNAGNGSVTLGDITAKSVSVTADSINVGNLITSGATGISLVASHGSGSVHVNTGAITTTGGGAVVITTRGGNADVSIGGTVSAAGAFQIDASANGGGANVTLAHAATAKRIQINTFGPNGGGDITTKALHATGAAATDGVDLNAIDSASAFSDGQINVNGAITTVGGFVRLNAQGGGDSGGGNITVTGNINAGGSMMASGHYIGTSANGGGRIQLANVIAGTGVHIQTFSSHPSISVGNVTAGGSVSIQAMASGSHVGSASGPATVKTGNLSGTGVRVMARGHGASINITGTVAAHGPGSSGSITINADDFFTSSGITKAKVAGAMTAAKGITVNTNGAGGKISVGQLTADTVGCPISDCVAPQIMLSAFKGQVKANGDITMMHDNFHPGRVNIFGSDIRFGNITAAGSVTIGASGNSAGIVQASGTTLKAHDININLFASYGGSITLANLTASSAAHVAGVSVRAVSNSGSNHVTINGNVTANGKAGNSGFSSAMPGFGIPAGAFVDIEALGKPTLSHTVKVNGNIDVTAHAGAFNVSRGSCGECAPQRIFKEHGTGATGQVRLFAQGSAGSAQVTGTTTVKGTDADVDIEAVTIKTGALSVTGSGHTAVFSLSGSTSGGPVSGTSHNSFGRASVRLSGSSGASAALVTTGNIVVSGKGSATVDIESRKVVAGNITVSATAAKGSRSGDVTSTGGKFFPGIMGLPLDSGSYNAGRADVFIGGSHATSASSARSLPNQGQSVTAGNITVSGVGEAHITLAANTVQTKNLSATATKGTMVGKGSSGSANQHFKRTFNINGGEAGVDIFAGSGSVAGHVNVAGNITANGPTAGVKLEGDTIKVTGGISVAGSGGLITSDLVYSSISNHNYHTHFVGPGPVTSVNIGGATSTASVNVGGTVSVKGPGLIGVLITGGNVTLGGLSASASAVRNYSVLDTRVSATADNFTAGSVIALVTETSASNATGPVTVNGNVVLKASHGGSVIMPSQFNAAGQITVNATHDISVSGSGIGNRFNEIGHAVGHHASSSGSSGIPAGLPATLNAAGATLVAGGNIDLSGVNATMKGVMQLVADGNVVLSGVNLKVGALVVSASGSIHNGGTIGTIDAGTLLMKSGKNIDLSSTDITIGSGVLLDSHGLPVEPGDQTLLAGLRLAGLAPAAIAPNGLFQAAGSLTLGKLTLTGSYLYLQASSISILGPVSVPAGAVVQAAPVNSAASMGIENTGSNGSDFNLSNDTFLSLFPGATLVIGNSAETGAANIAQNGQIDIGDSNLIIATSGTITGLENVVSTGLITSLESLLGSAVPPPTPSEIDPNSSNNNNEAGNTNKKHGDISGEDITGTGDGGTISQDTDPSSVCH